MLSQPASLRREYFASKVILHPLLKQVYEQVLAGIQRAPKGTLVFVFGPTGVGKTTLRHKIAAQLTSELLPELQHAPDRFPVVEMEVPAPDSGRFDWMDYYLRGLQAFQEVRVHYRADHGVYAHALPESQATQTGRNGLTRRELRFALETALKQRRPLAFLHDEAQHFNAVARAKHLLSQMETIKSLAAMTEAVLVFFGTYGLLELTNLSAQLGRRSLDLHFPRYPVGSTEFKNVLWTFQRHLPLAVEPDLVGRQEYCYDQTAGCVGVLKEWLTRALEVALQEEAETLTDAHLRQSALSQAKRLQLAREIQDGEDYLQTSLDAEAEIQRRLHRERTPKPEKPASSARDASTHPSHPAPQPRRRVGERRPTRDAIASP